MGKASKTSAVGVKKTTLKVPAEGTKAVATALIDTSVQIQRMKRRTLAYPVERELARFRFTATSSFSRYEFKRAWLRDLAIVHAKAMSAEVYEDVPAAIDKSFGSHPRTRARLILQRYKGFH